MGILRITNPDELRPGHVALLAAVFLGLAGNCLLTSGGKSYVLPDGAREWRADSVLLGLVEVLDLNYAHPTPRGVEVKGLVAGWATAAAVLIVAIGLAGRAGSTGAAGQGADQDTVIDVSRPPGLLAAAQKTQLDPLVTAQGLLLVYLAWSWLSVLWSHAADFAVGGALGLSIYAAWTLALAWGLNRRGAQMAARGLLVVLVITAVLAILYKAERNPTLRASYPIGNPLFLAACLIPGLVQAAGLVLGGSAELVRGKLGGGAGRIVLGLAAGLILGAAFYLTRSRGPLLAVGVALAALPVFMIRKPRLRTGLFALVLVGLLAGGGYFYTQRHAPSVTGRSASLRVRFYAWDYALELIGQRPLRGHGEGGYALLADALAASDVERDPQALQDRIAHAHSEWLEIGADLGSVGLVLALGVVGLTLYGGGRALARAPAGPGRWTLAVLLAALAGLVVEESFNVGLRIDGLPLVYYTLLGLIWALAGPEQPRTVSLLLSRRGAGVAIGVLGLGTCLVAAEASRRDFAAARAAYDLNKAMQTGDVRQAVTLADQAARFRLSPQRRLSALQEQVAAHLHLSELAWTRYVQRLAALGDGSGAEAMQIALVQKDRAECAALVAGGRASLERLRTAAPRDQTIGWLEHGFARLQAEAILEQAGQAASQGDQEAAERLLAQAAAVRQAAAKSLEAYLQRQPFDPHLAAEYVLAMAGGELSAAMVMDVLGRPLRETPPPREYAALMERLWRQESFRDLVRPMLIQAQSQPATDTAVDSTQRWAPEKLRLAAIGEFALDEYEPAVSHLQAAAVLYDRLGTGPSLAAMSCQAELAHSLFFARPEEPSWAIAAAEAALYFMPQSEDGRILRNAVRDRLIWYHLAAGHEEFAGRLVQETLPVDDPARWATLLAGQYVDLAYALFDVLWPRQPEKLAEWSRRALELDDRAADGWLLAAEVAAYQHNAAETLRCVNEALRRGADKADAAGMIERAVLLMPDDAALRELAARLGLRPPESSEQPPAPVLEPEPDPATPP